ncbi:hypothetical protein, partial [Thalassoglobus neptunius]|uniref:hypothetical protein n=1 Tax=Thalassoglobus neptunius TaxID=1938619 RepID=UPI001E58C27F
QRRNNLYRHSRPRRSHPSTGFLINNSAPFFARRALRFLTDVYIWGLPTLIPPDFGPKSSSTERISPMPVDVTC